jgi:hypothetical protein
VVWVVVNVELVAIVGRQAGVLRVIADVQEPAVGDVLAAGRKVLLKRAGVAGLAAAAERPVLVEAEVAPVVIATAA